MKKRVALQAFVWVDSARIQTGGSLSSVGRGTWTDGNRVFRQDLAAQHIEASRYAAQLDCSLKHFPREDFLLMRFEDLQSDPLTELRRICLSLEIDPDYAFPRVGRPSEAWPKSWLERVSGMFRRLGRAPVRSDRLAQGYGVDTSLW